VLTKLKQFEALNAFSILYASGKTFYSAHCRMDHYSNAKWIVSFDNQLLIKQQANCILVLQSSVGFTDAYTHVVCPAD